jgi:hypothetical protein
VKKLFLVLRWLVRKHGRECYDDTQAAYRFRFKSGRSFLILTEYNASKTPPRPTSGDPLAIKWSLWLRLGRDWYLGYGCVRTYCRNDDIEVWIDGRGPFSSASEQIELHPPIQTVFVDGAKEIKVKNAAINERAAAGTIEVSSPRLVLNPKAVFGPLKAGQSLNVLVHEAVLLVMSRRFYDESRLEVEIDSIRITMAPTGPERIERIYGFPEWFREGED